LILETDLLIPQKQITAIATLPVMESFYTLQGEGFHAGKAAYFIRLGGCNVGCVWCDVKESWDANTHPQMSIEDIVERAVETLQYNGSIENNIAVITGGEPLLHNLDELTSALHKAGFLTNIETSGSASLSGKWDWICVSPKKFKQPLPEMLQAANELKVVVYNKSDFAWAEQNALKTSAGCKLFLQAEWSRRQQMMPLIVDYIKANPQWQLSLQVHKYIDVP
jgi:7-carboxy-7-deazaguanine synthase